MEQDEAPIGQPENRLPKFWILLACIAVGVFFWFAVSPPRPGKPLKALSLEPLTFAGETVTLDDLKGQVVVLNFWGTWCPPCRKELPHIAELAGRFAGRRDCRVLAVSCGGGSRDPLSSIPSLRSETASLLNRVKLELPTYADPEGYTRQAVDAAVGFKGYPTTVVLDPAGVVRGVWTGYSPGDEEKVLALVETLLSKA